MKIVHLLGWYFPDSVGGTEVYVDALCRGLRDAGHDVFVAAPDASGAPTRTYDHDAIAVFRYAIPSDLTRDEACHRVPVRGAAALHDWLEAVRPDVVHLHSFTSGVGIHEVRAARRLGLRVIATSHLPGLGYMCRAGELMHRGQRPCDGAVTPAKCAECNLSRLRLAPLPARVCAALPIGASAALGRIPGPVGTACGMAASVAEYQALQREMFADVDTFVVLNDTARRMLVSNGSPPAKIAVNRLGVNGTHSSAPPPRELSRRRTVPPVRFGYVGRLHPTKGLIDLAHAVRRIPRDIPFTLEIRGPVLDERTRDFAAALRAIVADDSRVSFPGAVPPAAMSPVLRAIDLLLCPSITFENGPTVALEAHAVGTPVAGSRVGNLVELVEDGVNGRLLAPGDVAGWTRALAEIALAPEDTIDAWRRRIHPPRTMADVVRDYLTLYAA